MGKVKLMSKPKKDWWPPFKNNTAVTDVVWGPVEINGKNTIGWCGLTPSTKPFSNFMNKANGTIFENADISIIPNWYYDEIVEYAYQREDYKVNKISLYASDFIVVEEDYGRLMFAPYSDGVMLYGININKELRNKGVGTEVINKLYDLSEEMNIPIYLIPYPDDNFPTKDEKKYIDRLKAYYERIGFGPVSDKSLVWCNFE